jgi:hypothetical protein
MSALAVYLITTWRLATRPTRSTVDRLLFISSLLFAGLVRVDLFRFAAFSTVLLLVPHLKKFRASIAVDLGITVVLGAAGCMLLSYAYLGSTNNLATAALTRQDRSGLATRLARVENLVPNNLIVVGRAISSYSIVMPVRDSGPGESSLGPSGDSETLSSSRQLSVPSKQPSNPIFGEPLRHLLLSPTGLLALYGIVLVLGHAAVLCFVQAFAGHAFHLILITQWITGWLLYTWFNPFEPFLWVAEFMPLHIAALAAVIRGVRWWAATAIVALLVAVHNWQHFYLPYL